jgi:heterotetrameric sarcosine oxidase gamma subunit
VPDPVISSHAAGILQVDALDSGERVRGLVEGMRGHADIVEIAPRRWWLISGDGQRVGKPDGLAPGAAAIVDLSSSRIVLKLRHPRWRDVVAKGCGIDLAGADFARRGYAATLFARFNVLLRLAEGADGCDLYVARSCEGSLRRWLEDALVEFETA